MTFDFAQQSIHALAWMDSRGYNRSTYRMLRGNDTVWIAFNGGLSMYLRFDAEGAMILHQVD